MFGEYSLITSNDNKIYAIIDSGTSRIAMNNDIYNGMLINNNKNCTNQLLYTEDYFNIFTSQCDAWQNLPD